MNRRLIPRLMLREIRGMKGRLLFFVLSLAVGVAAVVAVSGLSAAVQRSIGDQARELLAADLSVSSRRPLPAEVERLVSGFRGVDSGRVLELMTVAAASESGRSRLVELKAVDASYPFYGELVVDPQLPLSQLLGDERVVASPDALVQLDVAVGDEIRLGGESFVIAGVVLEEPDRDIGPFNVGPRIFIDHGGLERTGLVAFGSRVRHRLLVRVATTGADVETIAETLREEVADAAYLRIETASEARPSVRDGIRRAERFLGLVALLSLLIGGVGVAQVIRSWLATRLDAIAVLRCLGMRGREVLLLYLGQTVLLGLVGSLVGVVAGLVVQAAVPTLLGDLLPGMEHPVWQLAPVARGIGVGVGVSLLFSLPALMTVRRVPPVRVLRRNVEPLARGRLSRASSVLVVIAGVLVLAALQSGEGRTALLFTGGVIATVLALVSGAALLMYAVRRIPRASVGPWLRHGLAALARPGADTAGAIVALGLGALVVLTMALVERRLADELEGELPEAAPSAFFVDVQPQQWPELESMLRGQEASAVDSVPVVMARLRAVDGVDVAELTAADEEGRRRWALTREQRLTWLDAFPEDNELVAGSWWSDEIPAEVSVEVEFARELGVDVGSTIRVDVQGVPVDLEVTSLRRVEWRTFRINFFLVVEPGVLEGAPHTRLAAARLSPVREELIRDEVTAAFPNVTTVPVREVLERVASVMRRLGVGVRFLGAFTVIAGIAILGGAASASSVRRGREVALLKTLGFTRLGVVAVYGVEFGLIGLVAGLIGSTGGTLLARAVLIHGMDVPWIFEPVPVALTVLGAAALTAVAGLVACAGALRRPPIEVLREE